ncbi:Pre-mRNA-splicing factor 3 [Striga hermonthica]|uniref:Pre-mRNA-splicing factor 3 n=1 Tax=Striga hermonthica TaxID=68872 RepID=A0A9N7RN08_STRHE|nr:Pre-mRNA-splicing factor 3 [Striga hermonthica]
MDKESSSRKRRDSDSHRDRDTPKDHHHHRSKHDGDRRRSDEHHRRRSDSRTEREGSEDREMRRERDRSRSVERKKRKEREGSEGRSDKRTKVYDDNDREKRRFEDDKRGKGSESPGYEGKYVNKDVKGDYDGSGKQGETGSVANGAATGPITTLSSTSFQTSPACSLSPTTKVSSITKTNENKGVNINRSHEVPGKSSTDGTASDVGKSRGLSLDALAKAKRALQMQKELALRMKKIPALNRDSASIGGGSSGVGEKEVAKFASSSKGILPTPAPPVSSSVIPSGAAVSASTLPSPSTTVTPPPSGLPHLPGLTPQKYEAVKRAQELAAKMGFRQDPEFAPLINMFPGQMPPEVTIQPKPSKAPVLRLDALGREVDEHGNVVNVPKVNSLSTLKVNINKQKKDAFQILKPELDVDPDENPHFDARMGIDKNKLLRPKKMTFQFVEEGKWSKEAEVIKLKSQFGEAKAKELKAKQVQLAKAKAEPDINPNLIEVGERVITKEKQQEPIPDVEWWDVPFLHSGTYGDVVDSEMIKENIKMDKITIYVEHPRPIEPPAEAAPPPPQPLKLTKKEQKKLRTQRRLAREKERQEMIRLEARPVWLESNKARRGPAAVSVCHCTCQFYKKSNQKNCP